jgi:hypothetical protein
MTSDELKLLRTLPESWQAVILAHEIRTLEQQHRPPPPGPVKCLTPLLADLERLKHLRDLLAEVQAPGYRRQEPEAAKGWLNRLLG